MQPGPVIEHFDVLKDRGSGGLPGFKMAAVIDFQLQIRKETLYHGVVIGHAGPAHAQPYFCFRRFCPVVEAPVLAALVVVKDQAWPWPTLQGRRLGWFYQPSKNAESRVWL
jgi:hypothetical protein